MKKLIYIFILLIFVIACKSTPKNTTPEDVIIADEPAAAEDKTKSTNASAKKTDNTKTESVKSDNTKTETAKTEDVSKNKLYLPNDTSIRVTDRGRILETNPKIIFKFVETNISSSASVSFAQVIEFMEKNPNVNIVVEAHTSNRGVAYPYNYNLSVIRARNGKAYLVERGIASDRLIESPLGEALPEYPTQNALRRYEFVIIENNEDLKKYNNYISKLDVKAESVYQGK